MPKIVWDLIKNFNKDYASAVSAITPFLLGVISWIYYKIYTESKLKEGDATSIVKTVFWTLGKKYKILAVHKFEKSDDISGYEQLSQNSRPDQWKKLINIKTFLGLRFKVTPNNSSDILTIVISRNGREKWRTINFNK